MIELKIKEMHLQDYEVTLEEASKDDNGMPVTLKQDLVYRFDDISQDEANVYRRKKKLRSADAYYISKENRNYFFEFKNARKNRLPWKTIMEKMHDSILVMSFLKAGSESFDECALNTEYYVIYNENVIGEKENESASFDNIKRVMKQLSRCEDEDLILGGLEIYKGVFYDQVYTVDISRWEEKFYPQIFNKDIVE